MIFDPYSLCDGEHFPTGGVDGDKPRGQQLLALRAVVPSVVQELINTDLCDAAASV